MADKTKYQRLFSLHTRFLTHGRLTIERMMTDYGINRRTANRDLNDLKALGVPLANTKLPGGQKVWFLPTGKKTIQIPFNLTDLTALTMSRGLFDFARGTLLAESMDKIFATIEKELEKAEDFANVALLSKKLHVIDEGPKHLDDTQVENLDEVLTGLLLSRKLDLTYRRGSGLTETLRLTPYTLVSYKRGLYLLGQTDPTCPLRLLAVERILDAVAIRHSSYTLPDDYDPADIFRDAFFITRGTPQKVTLLFDAASAPYLQVRRFHHSQKIHKQRDGKLRMTLNVPAGENDFEIVNWVMSFHKYVEVVAPKDLRARVINTLKESLDKYLAEPDQ